MSCLGTVRPLAPVWTRCEKAISNSQNCVILKMPKRRFGRWIGAMRGERARLEGKVAIVTGAGATGSGDFVGIGQAISILFARHGARVLLVDRDQGNGETTLATIKEEGGEASLFVGDVTSNADCQRMVQAALSDFGKLNVLVNNVGISGPGSVTDVDEDFWDTVIDVNLKSVMLTSKHAIPQMVEAGGGSIINLSSIVGLRAGSGRPSHPYAASKGGIIGLSNSMAVHYGRNNIRVNCIAPGHVHSPMVARHTSEEMLDLRRRAGPLGTEGTAWDVAWAALFLASDEARWISGVTLPVDAGLLAATPLAMYALLREPE
jgi:NAD(P)-dependent dehydrogenase (short-subunit alcohol dehydrogenase family)